MIFSRMTKESVPHDLKDTGVDHQFAPVRDDCTHYHLGLSCVQLALLFLGFPYLVSGTQSLCFFCERGAGTTAGKEAQHTVWPTFPLVR